MSKAGHRFPLVVPPFANYSPRAPGLVTLDEIPLGFSSNIQFILGGPGVPRTWAGSPPTTTDLPDLPVAWHEGGIKTYRSRFQTSGDFTPDSAKPAAGRLVQPFRSVVLSGGASNLFPWVGFGAFPGMSEDSRFVQDLAAGQVAWLIAGDLDGRLDIHFGLPAHSIDLTTRFDTPNSLRTTDHTRAGYAFGVPDPARYVGGEVLLVFANDANFGHLMLRDDFSNSPATAPLEVFAAIREQLRLAAPSFGKLGRLNLQLTDGPSGSAGLANNLPYFNAMCSTLEEYGENLVAGYDTCREALKAKVRDFFNL